MFDIGMPELFTIGIAILLLFGPEKLPDIARSMGKGMQKIKQAQAQFQNEFNNLKEEMKVQEDDLVQKNPFDDLKTNVVKSVEELKMSLKENPPKNDDNDKEIKE